MTRLVLPGSSAPLVLGEPTQLDTRSTPPTSRAVYAAAHVVADPLAACAANPGPDQIDWDATLRLRHDLWALGLGVAESMDTAQRGNGPGLGRRAGTRAADAGGGAVGGRQGRGGDRHRPTRRGRPRSSRSATPTSSRSRRSKSAGGEVVMMASRHLARAAQGPGRLPRGVRRGAVAGDATGGAALARVGVRSGTGRLLGIRRAEGAMDTVRRDHRPRTATRCAGSRCRCWTRHSR